MSNSNEKEAEVMAVMSKPKAIIPVLSEKNSKKLLSTPADKAAIEKIFRVSDKIRGKETKKN